MKGKVYFVSAPGRIKIGYTINPADRLEKLRQADMEPLEVLAIVDATRRAEKSLHAQLADFRLKGEWFRDCPVVREAMSEFVNCKDRESDGVLSKPSSALNEALFVAEAQRICAELVAREKRNGATSADAISLVAIKTGVSHGRLWHLRYRLPSSLTAGEIFALREAIAGSASPAVAAAKAALGED